MRIVPIHELEAVQVETYWQLLAFQDTLKYRLCDIEDPKWEDVKGMIQRMWPGMYYVVADEGIIAEYTLENFTGKSAQIHFSFLPGLENKEGVCRLVLETLLSPKNLLSVYGLVPTENRVACVFALRNGFKKIGILPGGMKYRGKVMDAMITVATLEDN